MSNAKNAKLDADLTPPELQVLVYAAKGFSVREIAGLIERSSHTAADQLKAAYSKIGESNRAAAAVWCCERGLVGTHPTVADELPEDYLCRLLLDAGHEVGCPVHPDTLRLVVARAVF